MIICVSFLYFFCFPSTIILSLIDRFRILLVKIISSLEWFSNWIVILLFE